MILRHFTKFSVVCLFSFLLFMEGCSTTIRPPDHLKTLLSPKMEKEAFQLQNFEAVGKIGFSDGKQGGNAIIQWEQQTNAYRLRLYGPLGSGSVQIRGDSNQVFLIREDGKILRAKNPEELLRVQFGWVIPVSGLSYWLRGMSAPGTPPTLIQLDDEQRLWQIKQHGWTIIYQAYQTVDGLPVPHKLILQNENIRLKFVFNRWTLY